MLWYTQVCVNAPPQTLKTFNSIISSIIVGKRGVDYIFTGDGGTMLRMECQ